MKPVIQGITISVDVGDKNFGNGQGSFMNLQAKYGDPGKPFEELTDVVAAGLDLYFTAWKTILAGRFATGKIETEEFKSILTAVTTRVEATQRYLRKHDGQHNE